MDVHKDLKEHLDELKVSSKGVWVILFEGTRLRMSSGKQSWTGSGAARNAFANEFYNYARDFGYRNGSELRKDLEEKGIIEIKQF